MLQATQQIKAGGVWYKSGEILPPLSPQDTATLLDLNAAKEVVESSIENATEIPDQETSTVSGVGALEKVVQGMTKAEQVEYATTIGLVLENTDDLTKAQIAEIILADAQEKGVDVGALPFTQLKKFARAVGIEPETDVTVEQLEEQIAVKLK